MSQDSPDHMGRLGTCKQLLQRAIVALSPTVLIFPMSLQSVRDFFLARQVTLPIIELEVDTATVALAAAAHGVEPGRIAKTLAFRLSDGRAILLVASGDARIDNRKFKEALGKGKMLGADDVLALTGH